FVSGGDIYVGDPATGTTRLLVGGPEDQFAPQFSPDGTRLAFRRGTADGSADIYVVRDDGSDPRRITPAPILDVVATTWRPDGTAIAVVEAANGPTTTLNLYDAPGSGSVRTLPPATGIDLVESRPPDGGELMSRPPGGLYAVDVDGSDAPPTLLASAPASNDFWGGATWSGDGSRIFYTRPYAEASPTGTC